MKENNDATKTTVHKQKKRKISPATELKKRPGLLGLLGRLGRDGTYTSLSGEYSI